MLQFDVNSPTLLADIRLGLEHVLIGEALPSQWDVPDKLWHTLRAILCWIIWKDHNDQVLGGERSEVHGIVRLA